MNQLFTRIANVVARITGRPATFIICIALIVLWGLSGPIFKFSDTWQLIVNTSTTIITFLMVFLIQNTQNRDNAALQAKLDILIECLPKADNRFIGIEHLTDKELEAIIEEFEARVGDDARLSPVQAASKRRADSKAAGRTASPRKTPARKQVAAKAAS